MSDAQAALQQQIDAFRQSIPILDDLARSIEERTGSPLLDWIDALHLVATPQRRERWRGLGWTALEPRSGLEVLRHPDPELPPVVLHEEPIARLDLRVEDLDAFLDTHDLRGSASLEGDEAACLRRASWCSGGPRSFGAVERQGAAFLVQHSTIVPRSARSLWKELLRSRRRSFDRPLEGLRELREQLHGCATDLGPGAAAELFLKVEREYWQLRNPAARIQFRRQQNLGLGWGNSGSHAFRCSRQAWPAALDVLEALGFRMEQGPDEPGRLRLDHPQCSARVLLEWDPSETLNDRGLWVALHGESLLEAGMQRLAAGKPRTRSSDDWAKEERWQVNPARLELLVQQGVIQAQEAEQLQREGALGSSLVPRHA